MDRKKLRCLFNDFCKELSYDDILFIKDEISNVLYDRLEWQPLKFYNPYKDEMIDFSDTHLVTYDKDAREYKIKSIKTNKLISKKEGKYGTYWTIKKVNIGEWQLEKCLKYHNEAVFDKEVITKLKDECIKYVKNFSSLEFRYIVGIKQSDIIALTESIDYELALKYDIFESFKKAFNKDDCCIMHSIAGAVVGRILHEMFEVEVKEKNKRYSEIKKELKYFIVSVLLNNKEIANTLKLSMNDYNKKIKDYDFDKLTDDDIEQLFNRKDMHKLIVGTYPDGSERTFKGFLLHYIVLRMAIKIFGENEEMIYLIDHFPYRDIENDYLRVVERCYSAKYV